MEVLQDTYNETNIGRLSVPSDWEVTKLGDNASLKNGANFSTKDVGNGRLMVNVKDLYNFRPFVKIVNETRVGKIADSYILNDGDILFVRSSLVREGVGFSAMYRNNGEETVYSGFIIRARIESDKIFNPFIAYYLRSGLGRKKIVSLAGTVTITNIGQEALSMLPIPIPPLPEQQKIAEILSTVDEQISTTNKIIEKSKELKKGLMQKLFSEGIGHTEFKDTKIGRIPKYWEVKQLASICDIVMGQSPPSESYNENDTGLPLVQGNADIKSRITKPRIYTSQITKISEVDDIIMTVRAPVGAIAKSNIKSCIGRGVCALRVKSIDNEFLYQMLIEKETSWIRLEQGSTFSAVNSKDIKTFKIALPPLQEQQKIATILSEADAKIEKEQTQKAQLEQLKKGLMQQLLTGKKRVKV